MKTLQEKYKRLVELDKSYFTNNTSEIPDSEYDALRQDVEVSAREENNKEILSYLDTFTDEGLEHHAEVIHSNKMLSLQKILNDRQAVKDWMTKIRKDYPNATFQYSPKYDGVALSLRYLNKELIGCTRGDGKKGRNISKGLPNLSRWGKGLKPTEELRGELVIPSSVYAEELDKDPTLKHPRNVVSGIVARKEIQPINNSLVFMPYGKYVDGVVVEDNYYNYCDIDTVDKALDDVLLNVEQAIDGCVFRVYEASIRHELGNTNKYPRWAIAFKYKSETANSKIVDVEWSIGKSGANTPVIIVNPVILGISTVSRIGMSSLDILEELDLKIGDIVEITKGGEIIPHILKNHGGGTEKIEYPRMCPTCGTILERIGPKLICNNSMCHGKLSRYLEDMSTLLKVKGLGSVSSNKLMGLILNNNTTVSDELIKLTDEQGMSLMLFKILTKVPKTIEKALGKANGRKYYTALLEKLDNLTFKEFLMASGVPNLGDHMSDKIIESGYRNITDINIDSDMVGFTDHERTMLDKLCSIYGCVKYWVNYKFKEVEVKVIDVDIQSVLGISLDELIGKSVMVTGSFSVSRDVIKSYLKENGVSIKSAINSKLDILIAGEKASSSKVQKAKDLNITVL